MHPRGKWATAAAGRPCSVRAVAKVLFLLGLAAAALALSAMALVNDSRFLGPCAPTDAEAADLRATSALLLMSGAAQALAATLTLLVPKRALTFLACVVASRADYLANDVIRMVVGCHGHVQGALAVHYCLLVAMKLAALTSAFFVVALGEE